MIMMFNILYGIVVLVMLFVIVREIKVYLNQNKELDDLNSEVQRSEKLDVKFKRVYQKKDNDMFESAIDMVDSDTNDQ